MSDYKKITVFDKHKKSPFIKKLLEIQVTKKRKIIAGKSPDLIIDGNTGEVQGHQVFAINQKVDTETFTKVFAEGFRSIIPLSKSGREVFGFITSIVKPNKDSVIFEMDECKEYTGYKTDKPILKGLAELIEFELIARSKYHYRYFINPCMFFNGNRFTLIKSYQLDTTLDNRIEPNKTKQLD